MNYQKELDKIIEKLTEKPTLLVHSCCAPCSSYVLEYLSEFFDITVLYYNPNISPYEEYKKRSDELSRLVREMEKLKNVRVVISPYEPENFEKIAKIIEDSGASAITVHPRTRKMFYSGLADRSKIADVKKSVSIPVIGNGDITDAQSAASMFEKTNCDAIMIGRGSQGNPFIFTEINEYMEYGLVKTHISHKEKLEYMKEHLELLVKLKGEYVGVREARKHVAWYTKGMHGGATLRAEIFKTETSQKLISIIEEYKNFISEREEEQ